jgi:23S rRNA (pseudouridine1915-N3)-methyltransferase
MRVWILAIGKIKSGAERELLDQYVARATATGRNIGWASVEEIELQTRKPGQAAEQNALRDALPEGAVAVILDERGKALGSGELASQLDRWKEEGARDICFVIGGADGHDAAMRQRADLVVAFGPQTWPHKLARVMLAEQLYRATTILTGHPYHRE